MMEQNTKPEAPETSEAASTEFGMPVYTPEPSAPPSNTVQITAPMPSLGAHLPPKLLERYEILDEAGSGGIGIVYKARDRETGELVALKVLRPEIAADPAVFERFVNELRLARKITHKNVCRIHDFVRFNGTACITMEFVEGESLRQVLGRFGSMSLRKGLQIAQEICVGLREAHEQGIIHRDLKPENIMLDRSGHVKIMDFGIARSADTKTTHLGSVIGTPAYMAPEQAEGKPVDARADVYAVGLILYEIFTGRPAFTGDTPVSIAVKQIRETPPRPRDVEAAIPPDLEAVILKCLEKDPRERFQSVEDLETALLAPGTPPRRRMTRSVRLTAASALLVAAVLGAFSLGWKMKPASPLPAQDAGLVTVPQSAPTGGEQKTAESRGPAANPQQPSGSAPNPADASPTRKEPTPAKSQADMARHDFSLSEAAGFTQVGPISMRLNKADPKRQMYTVTVQMKENRVELRDRALLEPVSFYPDQSRRTLELVVSKIEEKHVKGYLLAPKSIKVVKPAAENQPQSPASKRSLLARLTGR